MNPILRHLLLSQPSIVKDGLVAEYRFDEGYGQILHDYWFGNHGQLGSTPGVDTNDPAWDSKGLNFVADDYVTCGDIGNFKKFTEIVVVKSNALQTCGLLTKSGDSGSREQSIFLVNNVIRSHIGDASGEWTTALDGTFALTNGMYYMIAITYDGVTEKLNINNSLNKTLSLVTSQKDTTIPFTIGADSAGSSLYLNGSVAYASIYNRALTQTEISQIYKSVKAKLSLKGVVLP